MSVNGTDFVVGRTGFVLDRLPLQYSSTYTVIPGLSSSSVICSAACTVVIYLYLLDSPDINMIVRHSLQSEYMYCTSDADLYLLDSLA